MAKRYSAIWALIFVVVLLGACRPGYEVPPDRLRMHLAGEPDTLNPILATDAYAGEVGGYLYDSLITVDLDTLEFKPKVAESWTFSADMRSFVFKLRKDVKWHDGAPLTAEDVVFSYNLVMDPKTKAPALKSVYGDIEKVRKIDDHTVEFKLSKSNFRSLQLCGAFPIVPKHILEKEGDLEHSEFSRAPVGNGPYVFKAWDTNRRILLERNENYWDKKPEIRTVEFKFFSGEVALQILKKGLIDLYQMTNLQWVRQTGSAKFNNEFYKISYAGRSYSFIGWKMDSPIFKDKTVRRAMALLLDRKKMKDKLLFGLASEVAGPFFPLSPQYNPKLVPLPYDPGEAKKLLAQAGWADTDKDGILDKEGLKFKFTFLLSSGSRFAENLATIMKEDYKKVGIVMDIDRLEWAAFLERLDKQDFDAVTLAWMMPNESDPHQVWHSSQADIRGSSNFIGYRNPKVDKLIEKARVEFNAKKRNALYYKFQEIIYDEQPYLFLYSSPSLLAVSKRFDNIIVHKAGIDTNEWRVKP